MPDFDVDGYFGPESAMPQQPQQGQEGVGGAIGTMTGWMESAGKRAAQQQAESQIKITHDVTGGTIQAANVPADYFTDLVEKSKKYDHIQALYEKDIQRIEAQKANLAAHPWQNALATIAGSMASQDPNPVTRGLGIAATRLNPTYEDLRRQEQPLLQGEEEALTKQSALTIAQQRTFEAANIKGTELAEKRTEKALQAARLIAQKGGGPLSEEAFTAHMHSYGIYDKQKIADAFIDHQEQAGIVVQGKDADSQRKVKDAKELAQIKADAKVDVEKRLAPLKAEQARVSGEIRARLAGQIRSDNAIDRREVAAYQKAEPGVMAVNSIKDSTAQLRKLIEEHPEAVGVIEGRVPEILITRDQAKVRAEFFTLLDATRQSINGGTRFWNPSEFQNLSPKLAMATKTERVNLGIMDALDDFANRNARNIVRSNPYVNWNDVQDVWGDHKQEIFGDKGFKQSVEEPKRTGAKGGDGGETKTYNGVTYRKKGDVWVDPSGKPAFKAQ